MNEGAGKTPSICEAGTVLWGKLEAEKSPCTRVLHLPCGGAPLAFVLPWLRQPHAESMIRDSWT